MLRTIKIILEMIKFEHTVFALPYAYIGAFLAVRGFPRLSDFIWITVAMVGARSFAMGLNRYIDREIDARNPRTAGRALPKGLLKPNSVLVFSLVSLGLFLLAVYQLAPLAQVLWPFFVLPFIVYSYTKRFTWLNHLVLGLCLGLAPIGAWIAITNNFEARLILLGLAVCFWVAGFDIIYACQDYKIDIEQGLHSIPARFGLHKGLKIAAIFHGLTVLLLVLTGFAFKLGLVYRIGVLLAAILLTYENSLVSPKDLSRINLAFFTVNGFISIGLFFFTALDLVIVSGVV
jgi:4-hydroxybenzoate polyprenyltransferase